MVDKDLLSIQEARALVRSARVAQAEFAGCDQDKVDAVIRAVAKAAAAQAEPLARLAVEETGFGKVEDKKTKNIQGEMKLSNIRPEIYEVFTITKLDRLFDIRDDEADALAAF